MGLTKGTSIKVLNAAPFQGPVEIEVRGSTLAIGRGLASKVFIEIPDGRLVQRPHPHGPHH
jgi:Fe2+ transport system protein FeoA